MDARPARAEVRRAALAVRLPRRAAAGRVRRSGCRGLGVRGGLGARLASVRLGRRQVALVEALERAACGRTAASA